MIIPIRDHNPSGRRPIVTYMLIVTNCVILFSYWFSSDDPLVMGPILQNWAMIPDMISHGQGYAGILTGMFLHGGIMHLIGNMLFLYIFGDNLEDELGHYNFLGYYLACGMIANLAQYVIDPTSQVPVVGASGAIAGIMGGYLLLYPRARVDVFFFFIIFYKIVKIPAWIVLGVWFAIQLFSGVGNAQDDIAYWAHIGGFVVGVIFMIPSFVARGGTAFWGKSDGHPNHPATDVSNIVGLRKTSIPRVRR